ncbi:Bug family tripartite tricarboxylate transporter substrate binding protein [Ramlibacter alkalitolerans]|uniref:Tripartite tricarboxylate transporter substrate binding protein n=1 Tax=Ramlibacter alkalitolerans TaxID=2039631 RepID=A0ABS1JST1_9BURK|nr:tripartite tricarboxylate transporter substrate binding protein [Ramlibacter alkalitolerans]MBL0426615.1 tripartite tricarboxylate transporter substrate binding protein [Ramlibacter alkalitolerans]
MPRFVVLVRLLLVALALAGGGAFAQSYPNKPIRLVVPFPPGGSADVVARSVAQAMSQGLGQSVVVENKAGADGIIASEAVMKSPPDGYTLLLATNTAFNAAPILHKVVPYNPVTDFTPVGKVGNFGFFVFVHDTVPARNLAQLIEHARANPGKLTYGSGNSTSIIATARLAQQAKVNLVHVPYKGDAPMTLDLLAGRVHMAIATGTLLPHVKEGKLRVLATLLPQRAGSLPEVPTLPESGAEQIPLTPWAGIFGPAKMPREIVDRLARELTRALAQPDVRAQLEGVAFQPQGSTAEELAVMLREQIEIWARAGKDAGIAPQ